MMRLRRPYTSALDCCRWIAALLVTAQHLRYLLFVEYGAVQQKTLVVQAFYFLTGLGRMAVIAFFVLSGFLVGGTAVSKFLRDRYDAREYAIHRFSRIYTVLLPALLIGGLIDTIGLQYFDASQLYTAPKQYGAVPVSETVVESLDAPTLIANLLMTQTWLAPVFGSNVPLWSLACEWWYYWIFWAFLGAASARNTFIARSAYGVFAALLFIFLPAKILLWFVFWLMGVALTWSDAIRRKIHPLFGLLIFGAIIVGIRYSYTFKPFNVPDPPAIQFAKDFAIALGFCILLISLRHIRRFSFGPARLHRTMARFSYTTYLAHFPIAVLIVAVAHDKFGIPFVQQPTIASAAYFCLTLAGTYVYCYVFAMLTEHKTPQIREALSREGPARMEAG
jgi:peptidoglycan/LPS O-acetylase OafA/YrhL